MKKNNLKLFGAVFALSCLAGCTYEAKANDYSDQLLISDDDLKNNNLGVVYDALVSNGTLNREVFDNIMSKIAAEKLTWFTTEEDGHAPIFTQAEFDAEINKLVNEKLYDKISSSSDYLDKDGHFDEQLFAIATSKANNRYDVTKGALDSYNKGKTIFTPEQKEDALENGMLGGTSDNNDANTILHRDYSNYRNVALIPEVKQTLLVSRYLETEKYNYLGAAYARKVSYIAVADDSTHPGEVAKILNAYANEYLSKPGATVNLNDLAKIVKGVDYSSSNTNPDHTLTTTLQTVVDTYSLRTKVENITDDLKKIVKFTGDTPDEDSNGNYIPLDKVLRDASLYSTYTNNGAYPVKVGVEKKRIELAKESLVTEGYFIANGGLTSLPDNLRTRLFNMRAAKDFQEVKNGTTNANGLGNYGYIKYLNGTCYLVNPQVHEGDVSNDVVIWDQSSSTYYIVIVEDALSSESLNVSDSVLEKVVKEGDSSLSGTALEDAKAALKKERELKAHEVAKMLAQQNSYIKSSTIHWLSDSTIRFNDQAVYDYFKSEYADAFPDEVEI